MKFSLTVPLLRSAPTGRAPSSAWTLSIAVVLAIVLSIGSPAEADGVPEIRGLKPVYALGESLSAEYENAPGQRGDLMVVVPAGAPPGPPYRAFVRLMGATEGVAELGILRQEGSWEIRLLENGSRTAIAASVPFEVRAQAAAAPAKAEAGTAADGLPEIRGLKPVYAPGESLSAEYENAPGQRGDLMVVVPAGAPPGPPYRAFVRLMGATEGVAELGILRQEGSWEIRLLENGSRTAIAASVPFEVRAQAAAAPAEAGPLEPEFDRLLGTWLVYSMCDDLRGEARPERMIASVVRDEQFASGISAEVYGLFRTAGERLEVAIGTGGEVTFEFRGWLGSGDKTKPFGLALQPFEGGPLLAGEVTGQAPCRHVVAGKLPGPAGQANPEGMLFNFEGTKIAKPFEMDQCRDLAEWMAGGSMVRSLGRQYNRAVLDAEAMLRLFGRDLPQWTEADARNVGWIFQSCYRLLENSGDAAAVHLTQALRSGPPFPLRTKPTPPNWRETLFALHGEVVADMITAWQRIDDGLVSIGSMVADRSAVHPLVGEWRGYFRCDQQEVFMRLTVAEDGEGLQDIRFDFAPGLEAFHSIGALAMEGRYADEDRTVTLTPRDWIKRPRRAMPIGFEGTLSEDGETIMGNVDGPASCADFSVAKRHRDSRPPNPAGLLYTYKTSDLITASADDCLAFAEWLAAGKAIRIGRSSLFSGLRDAEAMRRVLGKDLDQWGEFDHERFHAVARYCERLVKTQMDPHVSELVAEIDRTSGWVPEPLRMPKMDDEPRNWLRVEQLLIANARDIVKAAETLEQSAALPPTLASLDTIVATTKDASRRTLGPFRYLTDEEHETFMGDLAAALDAKSLQVEAEMVRGWSRHPRDFDGFEQVEAVYPPQRQEFTRRGLEAASTKLFIDFSAVMDRRADELWPTLLENSAAEFDRLDAHDLRAFPEMKDERFWSTKLSSYHQPAAVDDYYHAYTEVEARYRDLVERMVGRSKADILAWMEALPPSMQANEIIDLFSSKVFGTDAIPKRHPDILAAAEAKKQAYNPDGFQRPDIMMSLRRGQWDEVRLVGLEDLAYMTTTLRLLDRSCGNVVPRRSPALAAFVMSLSQRSVARIMQGNVASQAEAMRAFMLFMNGLMNQPGCTLDHFGNVIGCVSQQQFQDTQTLLLTSAEGSWDARQLQARSQCGAEGARSYVNGLLTYVSGRNLVSPEVPDFWAYAGSPDTILEEIR